MGFFLICVILFVYVSNEEYDDYDDQEDFYDRRVAMEKELLELLSEEEQETEDLYYMELNRTLSEDFGGLFGDFGD